jgi:hydrogenase-4 component B
MSIVLLLIGAGLLAVSGVPAALSGVRSRAGTILSALVNLVACGIGAAGVAAFFQEGRAECTLVRPWAMPLGQLAVGVDALSVLFVIPILVVAGLGAIYGLGYWPQARHPGNGRRLRGCWGLLAGAMMLIVLARDSVVLLMAWELMALAAFLLVATEDHKRDVRKAAWVYLVATHIGTLCLFGFFALLRATTGATALWPSLDGANGAPLTALAILGLVGFGMKAGVFPLHVWLPGAHANAPSHVSAVLSGVMLKMGVYGMFRVTGLTAHPPAWWGGVVLALGAVTALVGIAFAAGQQDYKRLLAYSSIENVGIITMGLGLALLGKAAAQPAWVVLGIGAALFHVLNHSLFKPLLFFGAGSLLHAVHTRRMDRLGGLGKTMPLTYLVFLAGGVAICGLPPLNGFASELLLYVGLLKTAQAPAGTSWAWAALAVPALAAVGAMAVASFVKLAGAIFQGEPRGTQRHAHDPQGAMALPLGALLALCVGIGVFPRAVFPVLEPAVQAWSGPAAGHMSLVLLAPLTWPMGLGVALLGGATVGMVGMTLLVRRRTSGRYAPAAGVGTWDCGYARPTNRMQYTGSSLAQMAVDLLAWAMWPRALRVRLRKAFPRTAVFGRSVPDTVLDRALLPVFDLACRGAGLLRGIQQGSVQAYLAYLLAILAVLVLMG